MNLSEKRTFKQERNEMAEEDYALPVFYDDDVRKTIKNILDKIDDPYVDFISIREVKFIIKEEVGEPLT